MITRSTRDELWRALTDGEFTVRYFFGTRVSSSWQVGAPIRYHGPDETTLVSGEVLGREQGKELVHTWRVHYDPALADELSTVRWQIEERGPSCKLTVIHELARAPKTRAHVGEGQDGWSVVLSGLKTLLETGSPLEIRAQA